MYIHARSIFMFPVQLTTSRIDNVTQLIHALLKALTIHTYINFVSLFSRPPAGLTTV